MNHNGEYFSGFYKGYFKWSRDYEEAKHLTYIEQFNTIVKYEPLMELVYDYV